MSLRRPGLALVAVLVVASSVACGGSGSSAPAAKRLGAAEPADSPKPSRRPAGSVSVLAKQPEGMAYDPSTDTLAVATREPNQLVLLRGATGAVVRKVPLPGHARHLQMAGPGGPVLVPGENSRQFLRVPLDQGGPTIAPSVEIGEYPHDAVQAPSGRTLVGDERGGKLVILDQQDSVVDTLGDSPQPGGLAPAGRGVAVVDVRAFTLSTYDVDRPRRLARVKAGRGPTHPMAIGGGRLAVVDTRGNAVRIYRTDSLAQVGGIALPGTPYGVAFDDRRQILWVTLTARNEVVGLDVSGTRPREVRRLATVRQPNTVAVDPGSGRLWVASRTTGRLQVVEGAAGT